MPNKFTPTKAVHFNQIVLSVIPRHTLTDIA